MDNQHLAEKHYLRPADVCRLLGISLTTLQRYDKRADFPAKIHISSRNVQYKTAEILDWIDAKQAEGEK